MSRPTWRLVACGLFPVALAGFAGEARAQVRPGTPVVVQSLVARRPPLLPDGAYQLTLTPASRDQHTLPGVRPIVVGARVTHTGDDVTVATSDGMTLHGSASVSHLKVSGAVATSTLTLELGGSGATASGVFRLAGHGGHELTGTAVVGPPARMVAHTSRSGGCHGFWDCVKEITGFDWSVFGH